MTRPSAASGTRRRLLAAAACLIAAPRVALAAADQQALVDRATLTVNEFMRDRHAADIRTLLQRARAVMVFPRIFRGGFILGGEGGSGVLVARDGAGNWSSPAFYSIGSGSIGLQAGVQDSQMMLFIMNDRALNALLQSQFKFGADASLAIATIGAGIEGSTTAALSADIVAVSRSRGLFAGVSLSGSILSRRNEDNAAYFGRPVSAEDIVLRMEVHNPAADNLRAALAAFSQTS
ncbi:lipid-binding SYLF domain-containing protein [Elioraea tepida]|uniref:Lipid-binding SYLF domain-containing protein n=1 Tax=Elioraea tepida TaxID=2843330 RepID=A0A975U471_9PROT|nr:lipid-binding SYLF domain-containing protein [Elioraea tepida]QXM25964.1 lipid-binding SYLF domain-containing protein [Elioraea tepida]